MQRLDGLKQGMGQLSAKLEDDKRQLYQQEGAMKDVEFLIKLIE